jgi:hypothetical protein
MRLAAAAHPSASPYETATRMGTRNRCNPAKHITIAAPLRNGIAAPLRGDVTTGIRRIRSIQKKAVSDFAWELFSVLVVCSRDSLILTIPPFGRFAHSG